MSNTTIAVTIGVIVLACHIVTAIALYKISKKHNVPLPFLSYFPIVNLYTLGTVADAVNLKEKKNTLLGGMLLAGGIVVSFIGTSLMSTTTHLAVVLYIFGVGFSLALIVGIYVSLYCIYKDYVNEPLKYLLISLIPTVIPFILFEMRDKEPIAGDYSYLSIGRGYALYTMLIPGVVLVFLFSYLPMMGVVLAFKQLDYSLGIFLSPTIGMRNFQVLFGGDAAWVITRNTLLYNSLFIVTGLVIPVSFAIMLNEIRLRFLSKTYQTILILPYFLSWVIVSYIGMAFLNVENGLLNTAIMPALTGEETEVAWYSRSAINYWPFILIFAHIWKSVGYSTVVYLAAIAGIDQELYEAARIDGAKRLAQIRYITLPSLSPLMIILTILAVGKIFNSDFGLFFQLPLNQGSLYPVTNVIETYVYNTLRGMGAQGPGLAAAAGLYQSIIGFILVMVTNTIVRKVDDSKALF